MCPITHLGSGIPEGRTISTHLTPPLRAAVAELQRLQDALRQPLTEASQLEAIWSGLAALRRQLPGVEATLNRAEEKAVLARTGATVDGLIAALGPAREARQATRALNDAIETFERQVNRPSATVASPDEARRLLGLLEQLRWKVEAIPTDDDGPRAQALASLNEAMDFARQQLETRAAELTDQGEVAAAERALRRIVEEAGGFEDAESVAKTLTRLDALGRTLQTPRDAPPSGELARVVREIAEVRAQIKDIVEGQEAARVIRNTIHGYNAAARTFEQGPPTPEVATNLRAHFLELADRLDRVSENAMPDELRAQHAQIAGAIQAIVVRLG